MSAYRIYRRNGNYYYLDKLTGKRTSLKTKNRDEAVRLALHRAEANHNPYANRKIAHTYMEFTDPQMLKRTWLQVMSELEKYGGESTQKRSRWATKSKAFDSIRNKLILETRSDDFLQILRSAGPSVNHFLRRFHNLALGLGWLPWPILPKKFWPPIRHARKRGITLEEHQQIIAREPNKERRLFYEMLWEIGASQSDAANMNQENIDWKNGVIYIHRHKLLHLDPIPAQITMGSRLIAILRELPSSGWLFPYLRTIDCKHRATEFHQRCEGLGITGVSLHSYRYAWAVRAREAGMPERFAQAVLGHASKAIHRAYSRGAQMKIPALEIWEEKAKDNVLHVDFKKTG